MTALLRMTDVSDKFVEKMKTHFMVKTDLPKVYEKMWKKMVELDGPQITI
jgi:hypothetical protein